MKKDFLFFVISLVILGIIIFSSCAKEASPIGGPRDTIPPALKWSRPANFAKNFKGKKIVFKFNEYFVLKDVDKNFFISPPFNKRPKMSIKGKRLILRFRDTLRDSVTYTIEFGDAIVDFTEGNVLKNFKFVFSTYDQIDTLQVHGRVIDALTLEPVKGIYVMLYKQSDFYDSIVYYQLPQYVTVTNDSGYFNILGVKKDKYLIFALDDFNKNFIYDGIENYIGFQLKPFIPYAKVDSTKITLKAGTVLHDAQTGEIIDTLETDSSFVQKKVVYYPYLTLRMFTEYTRPQQIVFVNREYPFKVFVRFNLPLYKDYVRVYSLDGIKSYRTEYLPNTDSVIIWILDKHFYLKDTLGFIIKYLIPLKKGQRLQIDTIYTNKPIKNNYSVEITPEKKEINFFDSLVFRTNILLRSLQKKNVYLIRYIDTLLYNPNEVQVKCFRTDPSEIKVLFYGNIHSIRSILIKNYGFVKGSFDRKNNLLTIKLPKVVAEFDTVAVEIIYFAKRFNNLELHYCSEKLVLVRQGIRDIQWIYPDKIDIFFEKPVEQFKAFNIDLKRLEISPLKVSLYLKKPDSVVNFKIQTLDFTDLSVHPSYFEKQINLTYNWQPNKPVLVARPDRGNIIVVFKKPIIKIQKIYIADFENIKRPLKYTFKKDTVRITLLNKDVKRMKFLKLIIQQTDLRWDKEITIIDTINAELEKNPLLKKTTLLQVVDFDLTAIKNYPRKFYIKADFVSNSRYKLLFLPKSIYDLYNNFNDTLLTFDFSIASKTDYGTIKLLIKNFNPKKFYLIAQLIDENNDVAYEQVLTKGKTLLFTKVLSGTYTIRIILDKNKDKHWTTGNYLRRWQPEPVFILKDKITVKANWTVEQDIDMKLLNY